jgi:hypothetical protein
LRCLTATAAVFLIGGSAAAQDEPQGPVGGRQTTITSETQFTAATGGAIGARRPGLWVQQAIAEHNGQLDIPGDVPEEEPSFFRSTFELIIEDILVFISDMLSGLDFLVGSLANVGGSTGQPAFIPISNATTSGQGTSVPIQ